MSSGKKNSPAWLLRKGLLLPHSPQPGIRPPEGETEAPGHCHLPSHSLLVKWKALGGVLRVMTSIFRVPAVYRTALRDGASLSLQGRGLHLPSLLPSPPPAMRAGGGRRAGLTFQAGHLKPHAGASAGLWREDSAQRGGRHNLFVLAMCGQAPTPGPDECKTGGCGGEKPPASRSRHLSTTSGLHLLKEGVCAGGKNLRVPQS